MNKFILLLVFIGLRVDSTQAQNGQWLPGNINLHHPGSDPFDPTLWERFIIDEFDVNGPPNPNLWTTKNNYSEPPWMGIIGISMTANTWVDQGKLFCMLEKKHDISGDYYTAGNIYSIDKIESGMLEAKIKMPDALWAHSTFWTISGDQLPGEIDIMEVQPKGDFRGRTKVPHHFYGYKFCDMQNPYFSHVQGFDAKVNFRVDKGFHIYTCIWDRYFIHIFIDHVYSHTETRLQYDMSNIESQKVDYPLYTTQQGYYWAKKSFVPVNENGAVIVGINIDDRGDWHFTKQDNGFTDIGNNRKAAWMEVEWVHVYKRKPCYYDEVITNSFLLPFDDISARHITLGTNDQTRDLSWKNIAKPWGGDVSQAGKYEGVTITLLPNFISKPEFIDATPCKTVDNLFDETNYTNHGLSTTWTPDPLDDIFDNTVQPSVSIFKARLCDNLLANPEEGYIEPELPELDSNELIDTFDCNDIDTVAVDSVITAALSNGDTLLADSIISYLTDTLGCPYWGGSGGQSKPGRRSNSSPAIQYRTVKNQAFIDRIRIYPNPTTGSFIIEIPQLGNYTIRVMNMLGATVYEGQMTDEQKKSIQMDAGLPPGNYTIHISGDGLRHVERITLIK